MLDGNGSRRAWAQRAAVRSEKTPARCRRYQEKAGKALSLSRLVVVVCFFDLVEIV
jgi:hypothetical protein